MADTLVAADASPLIGLAAAGAFDLLRRLFGRITVTTVVRDEVTAGVHLPGAHETSKAIADGWIDVVRGPHDLTAFAGLDPGEASTIALALAHSGRCLVLIDEPFGRTYAQARGVAVTGLAGVLLAAKRAGFVPRVGPFFDRLQESNFRLSRELVRTVLEQAGEA